MSAARRQSRRGTRRVGYIHRSKRSMSSWGVFEISEGATFALVPIVLIVAGLIIAFVMGKGR